MEQTSQSSQRMQFQKQISGVREALFRTSLLQGDAPEYTVSEVDSFLRSLVCSKARLPKISPDTLSLRMLNILCQAKEAQLLPPFSLNYGKQGMTVNGVLSIPKTLESPSTGKECTLLDILEADVPEKYFLSAEQTLRLLKDS